MGTYFLNGSPTVDACDAEAPLVFATGALTGSRIPSASRMMISAFSPLTGTICSSSVGGGLAVAMKKAGIDVIHITGRGDKQTVILVNDHSVSFEDTSWARDTPLSSVFGRFGSFKGSVAAVGEAAFRSCRYASIMVDSSFTSGRGGLGMVMASKNLRAVAVRGSGVLAGEARDKEALETARRDIIRLFDASPAIMGRSGISAYGTSALVDLIASRRMMPTANFRRTYFEGYRAFSGPAIRSKEHPAHYACHGCPIACKQKSSREIPEYETLSHFGALNENDDLESIIEANHICNETGMDTITAAATIACLAEIKGTRYAGEVLVDKVRSIMGEGHEAERLRMGSSILAKELGAPGMSMSVKALELPAYDPRGAYGMALAYGTSTRGGCHLRAYPIAHEILRKPVARTGFRFPQGPHHQDRGRPSMPSSTPSGLQFAAWASWRIRQGVRRVTALLRQPGSAQDRDNIYTLTPTSTASAALPQGRHAPRAFLREPARRAGIEIVPVDKAAYEDACRYTTGSGGAMKTDLTSTHEGLGYAASGEQISQETAGPWLIEGPHDARSME
jgi:aldehyde:ferredoxin oxidoreductase